MCCTSNPNNLHGVINLNDLTKNQQNIHSTNNEINNHNNDECSILISSSSI